MKTNRIFTSGLGFVTTIVILSGQMFADEGFLTREQALAALFPDAEIQAETIFLTEAEIEEARILSGEEILSALIARHTILKQGVPIARGYVDTHTVRTERESLLIVLDTGGKVLRVEVTASSEPPDYRATEGFYRQYEGKILNDDLNIDRTIRPMAGATLTGKSANQAVRRILAIDRILKQKRDSP